MKLQENGESYIMQSYMYFEKVILASINKQKKVFTLLHEVNMLLFKKALIPFSPSTLQIYIS